MPTLQEIRDTLPAPWVERGPEFIKPGVPDFPDHDRMDLRLGPDLVLVIRILKPAAKERERLRELRYGRPEPREQIAVELKTCAYDGYFAPPDLDSVLRWASGTIARAVLMGVEVSYLPPWLKPLVDADLDRALAHVAATRQALKETSC